MLIAFCGCFRLADQFFDLTGKQTWMKQDGLSRQSVYLKLVFWPFLSFLPFCRINKLCRLKKPECIAPLYTLLPALMTRSTKLPEAQNPARSTPSSTAGRAQSIMHM